jgi:hypothetical protein
MLTGLAIMSFMDIKRRAVPVYMIIVMSILAIGIKIAEYIFGYKKVDVYEMFINSEGDVAQAILNKNIHADMWRMRIHNYYSNKSDAQDELINIRLKADAENAISIDLANANKK